jgi:sugar/nucleoside kinase (ribokinase family)
MPRILCIGDLMLDVVVLIDSQIHYGSDTPSRISTHGGGAAANTATWLAHEGSDVFLVSRTGNDSAAQAVISELDSWKIKHKDLRRHDRKTGVVVVIVDETGQRTMFPDSGANSGLDIEDLPELLDFDAVFLSGYSLFNRESTAGVERIIKMIKQSGTPLFFDPASVGTISHFGKEAALKYLSDVDVLLLNEEEALFLTGADSHLEALRSLKDICKTVVIKRGALGAVGSNVNSETVVAETAQLTPVDTTGAGDAFAAGFIPVWIESGDLHKAMSNGNEVAAHCVAIIGARPSVNPR